MRKRRRIKRKRPFIKNRLFWFGVLGLGTVVFVLWFVAFAPAVRLGELRIEGTEKIGAGDVEKEARAVLEGTFLFVSTDSILFARSREVRQRLLSVFPSIEEVRVQRNFFDRSLLVQVKERKKIAVWCGRSLAECFEIDQNGVIFAKAEAHDDFLLVGAFQNLSFQLGQEVIPADLALTIDRVRREIETFEVSTQEQMRLSRAEVVSPGRLTLRTSESWELYINPQENISWQVSKLRAVLERKIPPEKRKGLEYIDLRFGDQAYVKYR